MSDLKENGFSPDSTDEQAAVQFSTQAAEQLKPNRHKEETRSFWVGVAVFLFVISCGLLGGMERTPGLPIARVIAGLALGISVANLAGIFPTDSRLNTKAGIFWTRLCGVITTILIVFAFNPETTREYLNSW